MCAGRGGAAAFVDMCVILCSVFGTGAAQQRQVWGQVERSVDMQCVVPVPKITQWDTLRLFLQRRVPSSDPPVVFSYSNGQEQPDHQAWAYKNRCRLFKDNLTVSLSHISPSDQGEYDCKIFLWGPGGHQLEYTGQLLLSIWADYSRPQISLVGGRDGVVHTAVCSSIGGYPRGDIEWISNSNTLDLRNKTKTWADYNPQTLLYNVSGHLTLPPSVMGPICCCVVAAGRKVCSDNAGLPDREISGAGGQETRESPVLICLSLMMSLTLHLMDRAAIRVPAGGAV